MKRVDLIKALESDGCVLIRHGAKHDWYQNPATGISQAVPRHREINEHLARRILRFLVGTRVDDRPSDSPPPEADEGDNES
jgi:predicted RNA binding protein YcfA (HicA-like mRNA interferase family)